jgi:glycosyltransferase involved in cell wall biosynthesis
MRVAMVDPSLFTLPYDAALARALAFEGCDVTLHARSPREADGELGGIDLATDFYPFAEARQMHALPRPLRLAIKGVDHFVSMRRLWRRLRAARPDVIHFQWLPLPLLDGRLLGKFRAIAPLVLTVHDTDPFNGSPTAWLQRLGVRRALQCFDRLIVHTRQGQARLLAQGVSAQRTDVLPHGGVPADCQAADPMQGVLTLLMFGKIKPYKGVDLLIDAFAALPLSLRSAARVRIVGKSYMDLAPLAAQARIRGVASEISIEPGFVAGDAMQNLFASGTIAVFPYREIEASGVLFQAIAYGRPIVASNLGSFAELLRDGVHGRLVPPGNVPALTQALAALLGDRAHLAACAASVRQLAHELPQWADVARGTVQIYTETLRAA